jgi:hypothetical protein
MHEVQANIPENELAFPMEQSIQVAEEAAPVALEYLPATQLVQLDAEGAFIKSEYDPAEHAVQILFDR